MNFPSILAVAGGGALGALSRWGIGLVAGRMGDAFWGTAFVNVAGSFGLGVAAVSLAGRGGALPLFLLVGFFGAFTTFSTFALDATRLFADRSFMAAGAYVTASVGLALAGFLGGAAIGRAVT